MIKVISAGGSIVAPDAVDVSFIRDFRDMLSDYLARQPEDKIVVVIGGGAPARRYQQAYRSLVPHPRPDEEDLIGISATRLNAQLLKSVFGELCTDPVVVDPSRRPDFTGRVLIGAGWKPGFSTDYDAVLLAEHFGASMLLNASNIKYVYSSDPKLDPDARPLKQISWEQLSRMVGEEWKPGANLPFDPIATRRAKKIGLRVVVALGTDLKNTRAILEDKPFEGTVIDTD